MKTYHCIQELIYELADLNWDSAIFVNQSAWMDDPQRAEILILEGDDELEDVAPGTHLPKIARNNGMGQLLDTETFRDVVNFEKKRNPVASVEDIIFVVNFYHEKDDFYAPR